MSGECPKCNEHAVDCRCHHTKNEWISKPDRNPNIACRNHGSDACFKGNRLYQVRKQESKHNLVNRLWDLET